MTKLTPSDSLTLKFGFRGCHSGGKTLESVVREMMTVTVLVLAGTPPSVAKATRVILDC